MNRLFFPFFLIIAFSSCKKENMCDCIKSTGRIQTQELTLPDFDTIYINDNINLILSSDTLCSIKIEAGKNILPLIKTEIKNNTLFISNNNKCNFMRSYDIPVNVYIRKPSYGGITTYSRGLVSSTNTIKSKIIDINIRGAGDVILDLDVDMVLGHMHGIGVMELNGKCGVLQSYSTGNGFIHCSNLETGYSYLWVDLTGHAYVNVSKELAVENWGSGNVYFKGSPPIISEKTTGTGKLIKLD